MSEHTTMWGSNISLVERELSPENFRILMLVKKDAEAYPIQVELKPEDAVAIGEMLVSTGARLVEQIAEERLRRDLEAN